MPADKASASKILRNYDERGAFSIHSADDCMGDYRRDKDDNIFSDMKNKTQEKQHGGAVQNSASAGLFN